MKMDHLKDEFQFYISAITITQGVLFAEEVSRFQFYISAITMHPFPETAAASQISILHKCDYNAAFLMRHAPSAHISILHKCDYNFNKYQNEFLLEKNFNST